MILVPERRVGERLVHRALQLVERRNQHLGDEATAEVAEVAARVGLHRFANRANEVAHLLRILAAVGLDAAAHVDAERMRAFEASRDVFGSSAAGRDHGAPRAIAAIGSQSKVRPVPPAIRVPRIEEGDGLGKAPPVRRQA